MAINFDGPNMVITLDTGVTDETVANIYSRWKDWVRLSDNAKFLPAFGQVGGDDLGGGVQSGINIFLRNDLGWRIRPPEENIVIKITGNLYPQDPNTTAYIPTVGGFDTLIRLDLSANALIVSGSGGASADDIWNALLTNHLDPDTMGEQMNKILTVAKFLGLR